MSRLVRHTVPGQSRRQMRYANGAPNCLGDKYPLVQRYFINNLFWTNCVLHRLTGINRKFIFTSRNILRNNGVVFEQHVHCDYEDRLSDVIQGQDYSD